MFRWPQETVRVSAREAFRERAAAERTGRSFNPYETTSRAEADRVVAAAGGTFVKTAPTKQQQNLCDFPVAAGKKATGVFVSSLDATFQRTGLRSAAQRS